MRFLALSVLILFSGTITLAQNLQDKISNKSSLVFSVNGAEILQKVSLEELDKSRIFEEALDEFTRGHELPVSKLNDYGVDFNQRMYLVSEYGEQDVNFNYFTYAIKDVKTFENTVENKMPYVKFETKDGLKIIHYNYDSKLFWDGKIAILMTADYAGREYMDDSYFYWDDYYGEETSAYAETTEVVEEAEEVPIEEMTEEEWKEYFKIKEEERLREEEEHRKRLEEQRKKREEKRKKLENSVEVEMFKRAQTFFSDELKSSGKHFKGRLDDEADASLWYANNFSFFDYMMYGRYMGIYSPMRSIFSFSNFFSGELNADLFLNETSIDIASSMTYFGEANETYERIMSQKIDKKFIKFIADDDIGYLSTSFNTEEAILAYPDVLENILTMYDTNYRDEYSIVGDLVTLVLDEEAISKAITGDAVFILNNISQKEVEYYSYDYDENYNYERVLKTRIRTVPDFLFIMGSEEEDLIRRAFNLGLKRDVLKAVAGGFEIMGVARELRMQLYIGYKDEMVALTSDKKKLAEFVNGGAGNKLSSNRAKEIAKNSAAFYLNLSKMFDKILATDEVRGSEKRMMTAAKEDLTDVRAQVSFSKGKARMFVTSDVPSAEKNGATYLLHFVDHMIETAKIRN